MSLEDWRWLNENRKTKLPPTGGPYYETTPPAAEQLEARLRAIEALLKKALYAELPDDGTEG